MANPLRWFRRHSKILMVVLGSGAMAIFGLGPVFDALSNPSTGGQRTEVVVAKWKNGEFTRNQIDNWQLRHSQTQRFLNAVAQQAQKEREDATPLRGIVQPIRGTNQAAIDSQICRRMMFAEQAIEEGIIVGDQTVNDFLAMASGEVGFSNNKLVLINREVNQKNCTLENIRRHLRLELLARQMNNYLLAGATKNLASRSRLNPVPTLSPAPTEALEDYLKISEQIECQVLPISVEQYVAKVTDQPSNSELKELYDEGKYDYPDRTGEQPGFKVHNKAKIKCLTGNLQTYLKQEMVNITDDLVKAEYDRLVAEKDIMVMEWVPEDDSIQINDPPPAMPGDSDDPSDNEAAPEGVAPPPTDDESENAAIPAPPENSIPKSTDDETTAKTEAETTPEKTDEPKEGADDQSRVAADSPLQFVSLNQQELQQEPAAEAKLTEPAGADAETTAAQQTPENSDSTGDDASQQMTDAAPEAETDDADADSADSAADRLLQDMLAEDKKKLTGEQRAKPLADVAEAIKEKLARPAAEVALKEAIDSAKIELNIYFQNYMDWSFEDENEKGEAPQPPDYKALAEEFNLVADETGLLDGFEVMETDIGKINVLGIQQTPYGFPQQVFRSLTEIVMVQRFDNIREFEPQVITDSSDGNQHIYWVVEKADSMIPEFADCQDQITSFWRQQQAFELALAEGEKIAAEVTSQQKLLREIYTERATETGSFTWYNTLQGIRLGSPAGVEAPGNEFMEAAFSLEKMQATAAPNSMRDTIYVIQLTSQRKPLSEQGDDYLENRFFAIQAVPREVQASSGAYWSDRLFEQYTEFDKQMEFKLLQQ